MCAPKLPLKVQPGHIRFTAGFSETVCVTATNVNDGRSVELEENLPDVASSETCTSFSHQKATPISHAIFG